MRGVLVFLVVTVAMPRLVCGENWQQLAQLPDREGFAGSFAGVSNEVLLVAGGANFPDKKPWEGGQKVWHDAVFALDRPDAQWKIVGKLPRPLGYGVCVTHDEAVICVGGSDAERHYADTFRLTWENGRLITSALPPLPQTLANSSGALVGHTLYVGGGLERPSGKEAVPNVWRLDLADAKAHWESVDDCPGGGRMLAVAANFDHAFWLIGGVELVAGENDKVERRYLRDACRFTPGKGWKRVDDLPHPIAAAPSPAPADAAGFYVLGGDDGTQVGGDPKLHRGFSKQIVRFSTASKNWIVAEGLPAPRVTVPCVAWGDTWVIPGGEMRPGVRSPQIWLMSPGMKK